ncbi:hypothetical protein SAMN05216474_0473 [Lishizhenia tianjinensis]|uniref:Uncharacterized protein n=1 Tax=Lishizhenia tianjinensis TaxID=477690 RepID=A0A1I6XVL8_9FLAO|nr:hypothetical protein SAMN05216474_0473 [Lishizhenia tianjinensis]
MFGEYPVGYTPKLDHYQKYCNERIVHINER